MTARYWTGSPPTNCDLCKGRIEVAFVDGRTFSGPWASMCLGCHIFKGYGLGSGQGQKYEQQENGRWLKTGG